METDTKINVWTVVTQDGQECDMDHCYKTVVWELPEKAFGVFATFADGSLPFCLGVYPDEKTANAVLNDLMAADRETFYMPGPDKPFTDVFFNALDEFSHISDGPRAENGGPTVDREKVKIQNQAFNTGAMAMYYWLYKHSNFDRDPEFEKIIISGFDDTFFYWINGGN